MRTKNKIAVLQYENKLPLACLLNEYYVGHIQV